VHGTTRRTIRRRQPPRGPTHGKPLPAATARDCASRKEARPATGPGQPLAHAASPVSAAVRRRQATGDLWACAEAGTPPVDGSRGQPGDSRGRSPVPAAIPRGRVCPLPAHRPAHRLRRLARFNTGPTGPTARDGHIFAFDLEHFDTLCGRREAGGSCLSYSG